MERILINIPLNTSLFMVRSISNGVCKAFYVFPVSNFKQLYFPVHYISQRGKINSLRDTVSNGLILPVCYRAANNEKRLVYFHKLQDVIQEGRQRNL